MVKTIEQLSTTDIANYLREHRHCAFILWQDMDALHCFEDNLGFSEGLEDAAREVMNNVDNAGDCSYGITWDTIDYEVWHYIKQNYHEIVRDWMSSQKLPPCSLDEVDNDTLTEEQRKIKDNLLKIAS